MENEYLDNKTYDLIGRLAYALYGQDIKISYTSLIQILKDNNLDDYGSERGVAGAVAATWRRWKDIKGIDSPICVSIAETFIGVDGEPAWVKYE